MSKKTGEVLKTGQRWHISVVNCGMEHTRNKAVNKKTVMNSFCNDVFCCLMVYVSRVVSSSVSIISSGGGGCLFSLGGRRRAVVPTNDSVDPKTDDDCPFETVKSVSIICFSSLDGRIVSVGRSKILSPMPIVNIAESKSFFLFFFCFLLNPFFLQVYTIKTWRPCVI